MEIYLANTPYHLVMSIINGCLRRDSMVFLLDMTGALERYAAAKFIDFFSGNFRYINLGSVNAVQKIINRNFLLGPITGSQTAEIASHILKQDLERIYAFNDSFPEIQYILSRSKSYDTKYIEDGSAPYNSHSVSHSITSLAQKILYGPYFDRINVLGTSRYIDANIFCYPTLARDENKAKPISQIIYSADAQQDLSQFSKLFDLESLIKKAGDSPINLFLPPPFENDSTFSCFEQLIRKSKEIPVVKQHPLSKLRLNSKLDFVEVDSFIPAEALLVRIKQIKLVYGYPTTTLMATKFLRPEITVRCVPSGRSKDQFFIANLIKSGVGILRNSA